MVWATAEFGYNEMYSRIKYNLGKTILNDKYEHTFADSIYSKMVQELHRLEDMVSKMGMIPVMDGKIQCLKDCIKKFEKMS